MKTLPVVFLWRFVKSIDDYGEIVSRWMMDPLPRYDNVAKRQFRENAEHPLVILEARNRKAHNWFFLALHKGFLNLPESIAGRWQNETHLRKWILVRVGWGDEREMEFEGKDAAKDAREMAVFLRGFEDYVFIQTIVISETHVKLIVRRAKSQAEDKMTAGDFEASAKAVLDELEAMIGLAPGSLKKEAGNRAMLD